MEAIDREELEDVDHCAAGRLLVPFSTSIYMISGGFYTLEVNADRSSEVALLTPPRPPDEVKLTLDVSALELNQPSFARRLIDDEHEYVQMEGLEGVFYAYGAYMMGLKLCRTLKTIEATSFQLTALRLGPFLQQLGRDVQSFFGGINDIVTINRVVIPEGGRDLEAIRSASGGCGAPPTRAFFAGAEKIVEAMLRLRGSDRALLTRYLRPARFDGLPEDTRQLWDSFHRCLVRTGVTDPLSSSYGCNEALLRFEASNAEAVGLFSSGPLLQPTGHCSEQPLAAIVTFEDAWLGQQVKANILSRTRSTRQPGANLTCGVISGVTFLWITEDATIESLVGLQSFTDLTELNLGEHSIADISPLSGLTNLTTLSLGDNSITDISALSGLTNLSRLYLDGNPDLSNIQPLLNNPGLGRDDEVNLRSTGVSCTDVTALQAKGVNVYSDFRPNSETGRIECVGILTGRWRGPANIQLDGLELDDKAVTVTGATRVEMIFSQTGNAISGTMLIRPIATWRVDGAMVSPFFGLPPIPPTAGPTGQVEGQVDANTIRWAVELGSQTCQYTASLTLERDKMDGTGSCTDSKIPGYRAELTFTMELSFSDRPEVVEAAPRDQSRSARRTDPPPRPSGRRGTPRTESVRVTDEVNFTGTWRGQGNVQMDGVVFNNRTTSMLCEAYSVEMSLSQTENSISGTMRALGGGMCRADGANVGASTAGPPAQVKGQVDGNTIRWMFDSGSQTCQYTASLASERDRITGTGSCTDSQRPGFRAEFTFTMTLNNP